jgi:hypothetical protein
MMQTWLNSDVTGATQRVLAARRIATLLVCSWAYYVPVDAECQRVVRQFICDAV